MNAAKIEDFALHLQREAQETLQWEDFLGVLALVVGSLDHEDFLIVVKGAYALYMVEARDGQSRMGIPR